MSVAQRIVAGTLQRAFSLNPEAMCLQQFGEDAGDLNTLHIV